MKQIPGSVECGPQRACCTGGDLPILFLKWQRLHGQVVPKQVNLDRMLDCMRRGNLITQIAPL